MKKIAILLLVTLCVSLGMSAQISPSFKNLQSNKNEQANEINPAKNVIDRSTP